MSSCMAAIKAIGAVAARTTYLPGCRQGPGPEPRGQRVARHAEPPAGQTLKMERFGKPAGAPVFLRLVRVHRR